MSARRATFARLTFAGDSTRAPHSLQKRAPDGSAELQREHWAPVSGVPQSEQNFPTAGAPHDGQMVDGEEAVLITGSQRPPDSATYRNYAARDETLIRSRVGFSELHH